MQIFFRLDLTIVKKELLLQRAKENAKKKENN